MSVNLKDIRNKHRVFRLKKVQLRRGAPDHHGVTDGEKCTAQETATEEGIRSQDTLIPRNTALLVNDLVYSQSSNMFRLCKQAIIRITFTRM